MKTVEYQKTIANTLLSKLELIDPSCILAGGAPRDWYLGNPANDLDFYVYLRTDLTLTWIMPQIEKALGITDLKLRSFQDIPNHYIKNPNIRSVVDFTYEGQDCQIILTLVPTFNIMKDFPIGLSRVWYKHGKIYTTREFRASVKKDVIVIDNPLYGAEDSYIQKIINKFPNYTVFDIRGGIYGK